MMDKLGDRMKQNYETRTQMFLPRRTYTILRLDGVAFHTYTKGLIKPFDPGLSEDFKSLSSHLLKNIQGAQLVYQQSDEISILITDFAKLSTDMWFDGNVQKICSVAASMASVKFNTLRNRRGDTKLATFDARVFTIPERAEVANYFLWRQKDCIRNSITSFAQAFYSHKELHGKSTKNRLEMLKETGVNWEQLPTLHKFGVLVSKFYLKFGMHHNNTVRGPVTFKDWFKEIPYYPREGIVVLPPEFANDP